MPRGWKRPDEMDRIRVSVTHSLISRSLLNRPSALQGDYTDLPSHLRRMADKYATRVRRTMQKSLDQKIARILADPSCKDFIIADAKDADMAFGLSAPGQSPEHYADEAKFRTLDEYRQLMRDIVAQGLIDIMLMSASSNEVLTIQERLFDNSHITPAVRANDTTDIWLASGTGRYGTQSSQPFRTATIDHIMCGKAECAPSERKLGADLGLYSITYNNDVHLDRPALLAYSQFRLEAEKKGFRHFLEVFAPNNCHGFDPKDVGRFVNDNIVRTLAGVTSRGRPVFLKIPYFGAEAMEMLAAYDSSLVVGILGGSSGTTFDAFNLIYQAKKHGARVALFGRKINNSEHQLSFVKYVRAVADDEILPAEAVRAYHGDLQTLGIIPYRSLEDDLQETSQATSYSGSSGSSGGGGTGRRPRDGSGGGTGRRSQPASAVPTPSSNGSTPDFSKMTSAEKAQWNLARWKRILD